MRALATVLALLLAGCGGNSPPSPPLPPVAISLDGAAWDFLYSPGMPAHPSGAPWYFDFPDCGGSPACSVNYLVAPVSLSLTTKKEMLATFAITMTGTPIFNYKLNPDNTCDAPATVRFFFQRAGDDLTGVGQYEFYRWWSNSVSWTLANVFPGPVTLIAPVTTDDSDQWSSVLGKKGNTDPVAQSGFDGARGNVANIGFTFGGGCFYGHGVNVSSGTARFQLTGFALN